VRFVLGAAVVMLVLAGCSDAKHRSQPRSTYSRQGVTVELPSGWHSARANLTPNLGPDPHEVLAVASYPLRYRPHQCAQFPVSALEDLGRSGALVELEERKAGAARSEFPPRPAHFGPGLGGPSEATACAPAVRMFERFFGFSDRRRHFYALVAFGPAASNATKDAAWRVLDSLKVRPGRAR
jgi:hypothetical protein